MNRKHSYRWFKICVGFGLFIAIAILLGLISFLLFKGFTQLSVNFLFTPAKNFGAAGGIWFQIVGSLIIIIFTAILTFPLALGTSLYIQVLLKHRKIQTMAHQVLLVLNGVPSIVFGLFGLIFFVHLLDTGVSWIIGSIILSIMILPMVIYSSIQSIQTINPSYLENASALGLNKWQIIKRVYIPNSLGGTLTGLCLGLARAIGETAPIMFIATAFSGVEIPHGPFEPVSTLPTHILALAQEAGNPKALANAWSAALVLIGLVFFINLLAFPFRKKAIRQ